MNYYEILRGKFLAVSFADDYSGIGMRHLYPLRGRASWPNNIKAQIGSVRPAMIEAMARFLVSAMIRF